MKVTAEIDYIDDAYGPQISIDQLVKIEVVQIIVEKLNQRLMELWEPEIITAVKQRIQSKVDELIGTQFDNMVGEKIVLFLDDKIKDLGKELIKNKLSVMLDRLMREA